jgi:enoyl-CoA hydratase/carnithine racemase
MSAILRLDLRSDAGNDRLTAAHVQRLLDTLEADHTADVVTIEGGADVFCAGLAFEELVHCDADRVATVLARYAMLLDVISTVPKPVVALVAGQAIGGGVGIAAAADLVLATPHATFALPEAIFGIVPAMVFPLLARRVGPTTARRLALTAASISAKEAWNVRLVDEVVDDLDVAVRRHTDRFERMDRRSIAAIKTLATVHERSPAEYRQHASRVFSDLASSDATRVRIARFLAGDTPWFDGGAE